MKISEDSIFIFIATSQGRLEDRFLYDVSYGVAVLKSKGVADKNIVIITDATKEIIVAKCPNMSDAYFCTSSSFESVIEGAECSNLFVVSSCHGSVNGIDSVQPIKPSPFNQAIMNNKHAKNVLVFLGQCYAGIFNFMDVRDDNKRIVYIGATGIDTSFSYKLNGVPWVANISVFALFRWIETPLDIDGDGICSITDLYKYVSLFTNNVTKDIEKNRTSHLVDAFVRLKMEEMRASAAGISSTSQITRDAIETIRNYSIPHQSPWMLNAIAAGSMYIE